MYDTIDAIRHHAGYFFSPDNMSFNAAGAIKTKHSPAQRSFATARQAAAFVREILKEEQRMTLVWEVIESQNGRRKEPISAHRAHRLKESLYIEHAHLHTSEKIITRAAWLEEAAPGYERRVFLQTRAWGEAPELALDQPYLWEGEATAVILSTSDSNMISREGPLRDLHNAVHYSDCAALLILPASLAEQRSHDSAALDVFVVGGCAAGTDGRVASLGKDSQIRYRELTQEVVDTSLDEVAKCVTAMMLERWGLAYASRDVRRNFNVKYIDRE